MVLGKLARASPLEPRPEQLSETRSENIQLTLRAVFQREEVATATILVNGDYAPGQPSYTGVIGWVEV